jgi:RHS repeat-associated protein
MEASAKAGGTAFRFDRLNHGPGRGKRAGCGQVKRGSDFGCRIRRFCVCGIRVNSMHDVADAYRPLPESEFYSQDAPSYYRARYYDPSTGRFLTEDPVRFNGGANFYDYALNSPLNLVDPFGENAQWGPIIWFFRLFGPPMMVPSSESGQPCFKRCYGEARVLGAGRPGIGAFKAPNLPGTLAVIPTQFTGTNGATPTAYLGAKGRLRPVIGQITVSIANPDTGEPMAPFGPITDVIGPTSNAAKLIRDFPGELILEVNGVRESFPRFLPVVVKVPKQLPCPTGTTEAK